MDDDDDDDDAPSTSGRIVLDDAAILRGFDLDPALGAWITARFLFIWTAFGYLSVPTLALLEGVDDVSALRTPHLALALVVAEIGKLGATSLMLRSELAGAASASSAADPWARWRCYPNRASMGADALRGVAFGLAASVAARLADASLVVSLLTAGTVDEARLLAGQLDDLNERRKDVTAAMLEKA